MSSQRASLPEASCHVNDGLGGHSLGWGQQGLMALVVIKSLVMKLSIDIGNW